MRARPIHHRMSVRPSGLFPSVLLRPVCSFVAGIPARTRLLQISRIIIIITIIIIKEPPGLLRMDGIRPDGLTIIPLHVGRHLVWDAMVVDTLASSYVQATAAMAGAAAEIATERKNTKYSDLLNTHVFVSLAMETLGPINITSQNFLRDLGRKLTTSTGDNRETCFLLQHLAITICFNSVAFRGSLPEGCNCNETDTHFRKATAYLFIVIAPCNYCCWME